MSTPTKLAPYLFPPSSNQLLHDLCVNHSLPRWCDNLRRFFHSSLHSRFVLFFQPSHELDPLASNLSILQKLAIREESLLHVDNACTASFQGNAFSAASLPELLTRLRPVVENAAKAATVGFGMAAKPSDGQQEAQRLLEAIDSQMIVRVVGKR